MIPGQDLEKFSCQKENRQEKIDREGPDLHNQIEGFIHTQVVGRGLDERTAKAYQMDLEHFYLWLEAEEENQDNSFAQKSEQKTCLPSAIYPLSKSVMIPVLSAKLSKAGYEERMETYLKYLSEEKRLRFSTISRKQRVFRYYLAYLAKQGIVKEYRPLRVVEQPEEGEGLRDTCLTKKEIDAFFQAIQQEYEELDSDFRRRVCLRDQVMMGLLFYHRIEISELLRMEVMDYNRKTAVLTVRRKRDKKRQVYLFSKVLQEQMARWLDEHEYFEHGGMFHGRMFLSKMGKPLSMKMVINIFDKYRMKAGIEKACTPKDLKNGLGRYAEELVRERG